MEEFKKINWNTDINDIVDEVFIKDERILKESVTYKILVGTFKDPFGIVRFDEMTTKPPVKPPQRRCKKKKKKNKAKPKEESKKEPKEENN